MDSSFPVFKQEPPRDVVADRPETLADVLRPHEVPFEKLKADYPFLPILQTLLGSAPNSLMLMEIHPPAFTIENVIVPALIGLPQSMFGLGQDLRVAALAMYAASREHGCQYCSLHCCTMGLRRGLREAAFDLGDDLTPREAAAVQLGKALGAVPPRMTKDVHAQLLDAMSPVDAAGCMTACVMMGWLGRVMDTLGLDMEAPLVDEVGPRLRARGWAPAKHAVSPPCDPIQVPAGPPRRGDGVLSRLEVVRCMPSALMYDMRCTSGVPSAPADVAAYLSDKVGHALPMVSRLDSGPARRAVALAVANGAVHPASRIPLALKGALGAALATAAEDDTLVDAMRALAAHRPDDAMGVHMPPAPLVDAVLDNARALYAAAESHADRADAAVADLKARGLDDRAAVAAALGLAMSTTPVVIPPPLLLLAQEHLAPAEMVELTAWMGVVAMLVRLSAFFAVAD